MSGGQLAPVDLSAHHDQVVDLDSTSVGPEDISSSHEHAENGMFLTTSCILVQYDILPEIFT